MKTSILRAHLESPTMGYDRRQRAVSCPRFSVFSNAGSLEAGQRTGLFKQALSLGAALLLAATTAPAASSEVLPVAIFDFESKDEGVRDLGPKAATLVNALLSAEPQIITVERAELEKVLGEQELGLSGTVKADTAAKVGQLTGAKVLVTGRVFKLDRDLVIVAKIISTETSRVYGEVVKRAGADALTELSGELARKIGKTITEKGDTLVAKRESREERVEKIAKALKDGKRPSVSVKLPERHFGQPVIDPAAETELTLVLQKTGFTVLDDKAKEKPDLEISGDAFSMYGLRKGNLISCKARVELNVHERKSGKLLVAERQTSMAVDITEQTAAKTALQNAAMDLAERLLPQLTSK